MAFCFDENKVIHVILFMLQCMGGSASIQRLYILLYLADVEHLIRHGSLITGDNYMAMRTGPAPLHILGMYRRLRETPLARTVNGRQRILLSIGEDGQVVAHHACDACVLAESEAACLFHAVHSHKDTTTEVMLERVRSIAWQDADNTGEISLVNMAVENGATPEMIRYIEMSFNDEINSFR